MKNHLTNDNTNGAYSDAELEALNAEINARLENEDLTVAHYRDIINNTCDQVQADFGA